MGSLVWYATHCLCCLAGAAREKDRNSFFQSLRRKGSPAASLPDTSADAAGPQPARSALSAPQSPVASGQLSLEQVQDSAAGVSRAEGGPSANGSMAAEAEQHALNASEASSVAAAAAGGKELHVAGASGSSQQRADATGNGDGCSSTGEAEAGGGEKARLVMPAEEEAFLRSLGWEACSDDEDEGA